MAQHAVQLSSWAHQNCTTLFFVEISQYCYVADFHKEHSTCMHACSTVDKYLPGITVIVLLV